MSFIKLPLLFFVLVIPLTAEPYSRPTFLATVKLFYTSNQGQNLPLKTIRVPCHGVSLDHSVELVSIAQLLSDPQQYHKEIVRVRGTVTQPELHIDESGLFIRFVFVLRDAKDTLIVFGHHDRTQGNIEIETDAQVEVIGIFWKDRIADNHHFQNNLEAITVTKYPPLHPNAA